MTVTDVEFDVSALIHEVIAETGLTNPRDIAEVVASRTPVEVLQAEYARMLPAEVRLVLAMQRKHVRETAKPDRRVRGRKRTSADLVRDWWSEFREQRVHVGGAEWKRAADLTVDDLLVVVAERRSRAESLMETADQWERLGKVLESSGKATVGGLRERDVRPIFG